MKTKEEVIQEAWGEAWEFAKNYVDDYGYVYGRFQYDYPQFNYDNFEGYEVIRPLSLRGLENNNGWVKIESEEDLPKDSGYYYCSQEWITPPTIEQIYYYSSDYKSFRNSVGCIEEVTHYQPIVKPKPPMY